MPAAPYPLAGDARDVVEDVRRLGGFGIAAHPDSPSPKLAWRDWTAPFDGIELLNPDTTWRTLLYESGLASKRQLITALVDYPFRPIETIANQLRDSQSIAAWQALAARRPVVAIAGVDAHAKLQWGSDPGSRYSLPFFGYATAFQVMSVHVATGGALTGDAAADADLVMRAIRAGHLYTAVDGLATPPAFEFVAANSRATAHAGDEIEQGGGVSLHVRSNAPPTFTTVVHRGTTVLASARDAGDWTVHANEEPGAYWVDILAPHHPQPTTWLRSNPVYIRSPKAAPVTETTSTPVVQSLFDGTSADLWKIEKDAASLADVDVATGVSGPELRLRYGLAGGAPLGQVAGIVYSTPNGIQSADRLTFTVRADRPMRISVQLRAKNADRWQRSVYADPSPRERTVRLDDMTPVGVTPTPAPPLADIISILLVVDVTNTKPGSSGFLWFSGVRLER
jgi:hypothetical protein